MSQVNIKTKTNDEKAKKKKNYGKDENNQKTQYEQKKFPELQVSKNNHVLGQPKATPGPAFVPYKLNGKTISSEAEEETLQRGHGSANKINQKTQSETEKNQDNQVN